MWRLETSCEAATTGCQPCRAAAAHVVDLGDGPRRLCGLHARIARLRAESRSVRGCEPTHSGEPWSDEDDVYLFKRSAMPARVVAAQLGRTIGAVHQRRARLRRAKLHEMAMIGRSRQRTPESTCQALTIGETRCLDEGVYRAVFGEREAVLCRFHARLARRAAIAVVVPEPDEERRPIEEPSPMSPAMLAIAS